MNLTLKDRVIILNSVLPKFDTRQNIELTKSIKDNISLSESENSVVVARDMGNNQFDISFKTAEAITNEETFDFSTEEVEFMKSRVAFIDSNGMFSEYTMDTYDKIINAVLS
jgi:hypothetical protein